MLHGFSRSRTPGSPSMFQCVGFLGWIDVFVAIPEPLVGPVSDWPEARRKKVGQKRCLIELHSKR